MNSSKSSNTQPFGICLQLDIRLFKAMGAGRGPAWLMQCAQVVAQRSWLLLLVIVVWVSWRRHQTLYLALVALLFAGFLQLLGKRMARRWQAKRPFVLGLCDNHLGHSFRAGFPSSHALVMGAVVGVLVPFAEPIPGMVMGAIAITTGWARVHTGAHFPSDVLVGLSAGFLGGLFLSKFL